MGADNLFSTVIELLQHRHVSANRCVSQTLTFDFTDLQMDASGTVGKSQFGYGFSEIVIRRTLKIACSEERERALDLLNKAGRLCLVSRAIDVPLKFEPEIEVTEPQLSV